MLAALNTYYYAEALRAAGLGTEDAIARVGSLEEALARLPRIDPGLIRMDSPALVNPTAPCGLRRELFWPLPPASRTAVISGFVEPNEGVRTFRGIKPHALARWRPEALAGPVGALRHLAEAGGGSLGLNHSVLAFSTLRRTFLTETLRELLWSTWKVPVFGQLLGLSRELLAWECEAHEGYHYDPPGVVFEVDTRGGRRELLATSLEALRRPMLRLATCLTGWIDSSPCGCGQRGPRLREVRPVSLARQSAAAASASCAGQGESHFRGTDARHQDVPPSRRVRLTGDLPAEHTLSGG